MELETENSNALACPVDTLVMRDFEHDLALLFGERMKEDDSFCENVWSALANVIWVNVDGAEYAASFRSGGGLVAEISGKGDYMTWYCSGEYSTISDEIMSGLATLGWTHKMYD